jgi:uncharacterized protein
MIQELPDEVDCRAHAGTRRALTGTVGAARLTRVASAYRVCSPVTVALTLAPDTHGRITLAGTLSATLEGRCQRCLEPLRFTVDTDVDLVALAAEGAARDEDSDWVLAPQGRLALLEIIEDELLLACPMIEAHDEPNCRAVVASTAADQRRRPFAALADLMRKR